jgi:hypothetical protein
MDDEVAGHWPESWIAGDGAARQPPSSALVRLASAVTVGPSPCLALRLGVPLMAIR